MLLIRFCHTVQCVGAVALSYCPVHIPILEVSQWPWSAVACAMGLVNTMVIVSRKRDYIFIQQDATPAETTSDASHRIDLH